MAAVETPTVRRSERLLKVKPAPSVPTQPDATQKAAKQPDITQKLTDLYYDPKFPGSLSAAQRFYTSAKQKIPDLKLNQVKNFLSREATVQLHNPVRRNYPRSKIFVRGPNDVSIISYQVPTFAQIGLILVDPGGLNGNGEHIQLQRWH